jgi:hypothetical protein
MAARDNAPGAARGRKPNGSHLLIGGLLRCRCGSALVPRSRSRSRPNATDTYECSGRRDHGTDFCPQGPLPRELIDGTILGRFEQIGLSVEATKRDYAEATEHQLQQARDALVQAERAERKASEALTRIRGDYKAGKLSSESWEDLKPELIEEQKAAAREVERLRAHEHDIANATALDDAEQAVLEWLTELREVIAGKVRNAESVEALRNALTRVFERFEFRPSPEGWHPPRYLVAVPREDALATKPGEWPEELHRTGICVPQVTRTG